MVVNGYIGEMLVPAFESCIPNESCREHPIASLSGHVVDAVSGQNEVTPQKPRRRRPSRDASRDNRPVLVSIARKEMANEIPVHTAGKRECPPLAHGLFLSQ